ncbi:MAG: tetratricopeptide repeat protein [Phycisphaerales bacterium]|nr:tetratricopeptide repeat protein [Phycisphaerales bacterium]
MAKRLNKTMVAGLTFAGMAVITVAGAVMVLSMQKRDPAPYLQQAEQAASRGEYETAMQYYRRAAMRAQDSGRPTPASNTYLTLAGEMALKAGMAADALQFWNNVMVNDAGNESAQEKIVAFRLELAGMSRSAATWGQLQQEAEKLCAINSKNYAGLHALGLAKINLQAIDPSYAEAGQKLLTEAVEGDPSQPDFTNDLARLYYSQNRHEDAENLYLQLIKALREQPNPDTAQLTKAYRYRGIYYAERAARLLPTGSAQGRTSVPEAIQRQIEEADAKALADLEEAIKVDPKDIESRIALGQYWLLRWNRSNEQDRALPENHELLAKAEEHYKAAIDMDRFQYVGYLRLAGLYSLDNRPEDARQVLQERIKLGIKRDHYLAWQNLQMMAVVRNEAFQIDMRLMATLPQKAKSQDEAQRETAKIRERMEDLYRETVQNTTGGEKDINALYMRGQLLMLDNKKTESISKLEEARKQLTGIDPRIERALAIMYVETNQLGLAAETLNRILTLTGGDVTLWMMMAHVQNRLNRYDEAIAAADRVLQIEPKHTGALSAKANALAALGNLEAASILRKQLAADLSQVNPEQAKIMEAANLMLQAGEKDPPDPTLFRKSEQLFREVVDTDPLNLTALRALIGIAQINKDRVEDIRKILANSKTIAEQRLAESASVADTAADQPRNAELLVKQIETLLLASDETLSEEEKNKHYEEMLREESDPIIKALGLSQLYARLGRTAEAQEQLRQAYQLKPDDPRIVEQLLFAAMQERKWTEVDELLAKAIQLGLDPSGEHYLRGRVLLSRSEVPEFAAELSEAVAHLRAGVQRYPSYSQGQLWLGLALMQMQNYEEALTAYKEALRLDPNNGSAAIGMARTYDLMGNENEKIQALELANRLLPNHPWVRTEMEAREDRRNPQAAIERREKMRQQEPSDVNNLLRLANLYTTVGQLGKAKDVYEQANAQLPNNLRLVDLYSRFLRDRMRDYAGADELLQKLVEGLADKDPVQKAGAQLLIAAHQHTLLQQGRPEAWSIEQVAEAYRKAAEYSDHSGISIEIGTFLLNINEPAEAEAWLRKAIAKADSDPTQTANGRLAHSRLIDLLVQLRDPSRDEDIRKEIASYRAQYDEDFAILAEGEFASRLGRDAEALDRLTRYIERNPDNPMGYYRRSLVYFRLNKWKEAIADLQDSSRLNPSFAEYEPRILLARALRYDGQTEPAIRELRSLLDSGYETPDLVRQLVEIYMQIERFDAAENLIAPRARSQPQQPLWPFMLAEISSRRNRGNETIQYARQAAELSDYESSFLHYLLSTYFKFQRYDDMIDFTTNQLPAERRIPTVVMLLGSAYAGKGDIPQAVERYIEALNDQAAPLEVLFAFLREDIQERRIASTEQLMTAVQERLQANPGERGSLYLLSFLQDRQDDYAGQKQTLQTLLTGLTGEDARSQYEQFYITRLLATVMNRTKDHEAARQLYESVLAMRPNDVMSLNNLAYLLLEDLKEPKAALPYAKRAVELAPGDANVLDTLGWCHLALGEYDQGIGRLREAIQINPMVATFHYHVAEGLYRRSQVSGNPDTETDRSAAKDACQLAHRMIMDNGQDPHGDLPQIVKLGEQLGLILDKEIPSRP